MASSAQRHGAEADGSRLMSGLAERSPLGTRWSWGDGGWRFIGAHASKQLGVAVSSCRLFGRIPGSSWAGSLRARNIETVGAGY